MIPFEVIRNAFLPLEIAALMSRVVLRAAQSASGPIPTIGTGAKSPTLTHPRPCAPRKGGRREHDRHCPISATTPWRSRYSVTAVGSGCRIWRFDVAYHAFRNAVAVSAGTRLLREDLREPERRRRRPLWNRVSGTRDKRAESLPVRLLANSRITLR